MPESPTRVGGKRTSRRTSCAGTSPSATTRGTISGSGKPCCRTRPTICATACSSSTRPASAASTATTPRPRASSCPRPTLRSSSSRPIPRSPTPSGSSSRREIREEAARVFFVLNKVDYLTGPDRDEAIAFTRGVIADAVGRDVVLYPMSARQALVARLVGDDEELEASGLPAFERDLRRFLLREKGETILRSVAVRAVRLVEAERNSLDVQERALQLPQRELEEARRRMDETFTQARRSQRDLRALLENEGSALVAVVEGDLAALRREEEARLAGVVDGFLATHEDVRDPGELDELVKDRLRADVDRWRRDEEDRLAGSFREATARFVAEADRIDRETVTLCGEILGIELASEPAPVELPAESEFSFDFFEVPTILESILPDVRRLLPRGTARRLVERDLRRRIPEWVDKHSGRLRYDFVQRLDRSQRELRRTLDERLEATIANLRAGMERSERDRQRTQEEARSAGERLRELRGRLDRLREEFLRPAGSGSDLEGRTA